ncbi:MAG: DUF2953 domain-containing protein [Lachnospiraceae bacterium]|nr:DUF2953 domain-containing protein [Lachnospiraceae bacterium]
MISIFLTILKITGIVLLSLLLLLVTVLLLILFVPVRYRVSGFRKQGDEVPVNVALKVTWFLHIVNVAFRYPEEAFIKVRLFCFTIFSTDKEQTGKKKKEQKDLSEEAIDKEEKPKTVTAGEETDHLEEELKEKEEAFEKEDDPKISSFIKKLFSILKNIKYTICQIYGKIKHIIKNIRYYIRILKSDTFKRAWSFCSREVFILLKSILPRKFSADFVVGTGDPASTAQILSIQGILYPLVGEHINITPDFEHSIVEGNFFVKGKITVWRILLTAVRVYFNRDLRRVIRLFKKEAA